MPRSHCRSKHVFQRGFRCPRCGVRLLVSANYLRVLFIVAIAIGFASVWEARVRGLGFFLLGLLTAFLVSTVLVRIVPYVVGPRFVLSDPEHVTTLGLTGEGEDSPESVVPKDSLDS